MCGIYGSIGFMPERSRIGFVAHRGPDGEGWREFASPAGAVALGHRRLAIIDETDAGLQPMAASGGRYHLSFNGEIYNYRELKSELAAQGRIFATQTDSEVLLAAYERWGEGCLDRLVGMFAFLVWDDDRKRLFAARDRFGVKPLYLVANAAGVAFGSEIKQLLGLPGLPGRLDRSRTRDFLLHGVMDHTRGTLFEGVEQVAPGSFVVVDASRTRPSPPVESRWYAPPPHDGLDLPEAEAGERFRALLEDSVRLHLRADVPVGSCLSGGLDSSSIVCIASRLLRDDAAGAAFHTVSACYPEQYVDEKPFMDAVVACAGTTPHYVYPTADDVRRLAGDITWHQDEPIGSTSIVAQWRVFEEARRAGVKVMLDGQGADEQLAGYHWCYGYRLAEMLRRLRVLSAIGEMRARRAAQGVGHGSQALRALMPLLPPGLRGAGERLRRATSERHRWARSDVFRALGPPEPVLDRASRENGLPPARDVAGLCLALTFGANLQMLLHWEDRSSMAHSIEARVPFLDHRLVEFSLALGGRHKLVGADTKRVLRRAMADVLPRPVLERRDKLGFATPERTWMRGPLRDFVLGGVEATLARFPGLLEPAGTRALARDMLDGRRELDFTLWRIVNMGIWGERFGVGL